MFKQWGEWSPTDLPAAQVAAQDDHDVTFWAGTKLHSLRVGKKRAGRTLDGKLHDDLVWDMEES